jgi:superfamily II DNA/RNA helicase
MGFLPDVNNILDYIPHKNARQTLLFGATLPKEVEKLAQSLQKRSLLVDLGRSTPPETITHGAFEVEVDEKYDVLVELLKDEKLEKVIIFTQSKHEARITARNLRRDGLELEEIHGGLTQRQRNHAIANFRADEVQCLVASDVAACGLDIMDVSHIISYDVPSDFNMYIHRAGRTGRAFKSGVSWIIASPKEFGNLANIDTKLGMKVPRLRTLKKEKKPWKGNIRKLTDQKYRKKR